MAAGVGANQLRPAGDVEQGRGQVQGLGEQAPLLQRAPVQAPPPSSSVFSHYVHQVFNRRNLPNLVTSAGLTVATSSLIVATPLLFSKIFEQGKIDIWGVNLNRYEVIACFASALFLTRVLPVARRMIHNSIVSTATFNTLYGYDKQDLHQTYGYQQTTHVGIKQDQMVTAIMGSTDLTAHTLNTIIPSACEIAAGVGVLSGLYGWEIGVWISGTTVLSLAYNALTANFVRSAYAQYKLDRMNHYRYIAELWTNFESLYYFNTLQYEVGKLREILDRAQASDVNNLHVPDRISILNTIGTQAFLFGLLMYCGKKMADGTYSVQELAVIIYFIIQVGIPLTNMGESLNKVRAVYQDLTPVIAFISRPIANQNPPPPPLVIPEEGAEISFNRVSFSHNQVHILNDISFRARAGQTLALVGLTGAGKSTIGKLLYRLYDATGGQIQINGQDISLVDTNSLRNQLSIVPQNPVLFNETIKYNITYGAVSLGRQVTDDMIWHALDQAGLGDKVRGWPDGLNTRVGQAGTRLSGGELLRVALARAILRDAPIVILDEFTSALDAETEQLVQRHINNDLARKLKIVIAHRLSTIRRADNILVLNNGIIAEQGTFDQLVGRQGGIFKALWEKQTVLARYQDDAGTV